MIFLFFVLKKKKAFKSIFQKISGYTRSKITEEDMYFYFV